MNLTCIMCRSVGDCNYGSIYSHHGKLRYYILMYMCIHIVIEQLLVLEEQCCTTQLHPLYVNPPTRYVQTSN